MIKYAISGLLLINILLVTAFFQQNSQITQLEKVVEEQTILKDSIISFTEKEFEQYLKLKDQKKRYQKADELFGKVMLLFLAELGLKIPEPKMRQLEDMAKAISIGEKEELTVVSNPYDESSRCEPCPQFSAF
jgi:regulatory protein YycI of two-component signal transduction system YycFG